ncbi:MAG TPA: winged helix-turn-helix domain-containing protein [Gammaproteobacteria bacterium]|nr:winged helix-turn-helix domain-containing protein [Gammaproteobacteria bacterium]
MDITPNLPSTRYVFGEFEFEPRSGELRDGQKTVLLRPQVAKLLTLLLSHADSIVSREEIRNCLWGSHAVVEFEEGISACMRQLRIALNDGTTGTRYIQTISRRGYKFVFPVTATDSDRPIIRHAATSLSAQPQRADPAVTERKLPWKLLSALFVLLALAVSVALVAHFKYRVQFFTQTQPSTQTPVIAVLPFANLSTNSTNTILGVSIASELIDLLGPISPDRLGVIAETSSMHFATSGKTIKSIGQDLGATYVLEGSITQKPKFIHIAARLIRTADQSYIWGDDYDLDVRYQNTDYQKTIVQIATHVAALLAPDVSIKPLEFTSNRQAALDYQLGKYSLVQGNYTKAGDYCHHAMTLDPQFAAAYECTAKSMLAMPDVSAQQVETVRGLVKKALQLNNDSSEAHLLRGLLEMFFNWNLTTAGPEIREALRHNPGNAWAWQAKAAYFSALGESLQMRQSMLMAQSLDPVSMRISSNSAVLFYIDRQFDKAEQYAQTAVSLMPGDELARHVLILALLGESRYAEAIQQAVIEMQYAGASSTDIASVKAGKQEALVKYFRWYAATWTTRPPDKLTSVFLADAYMHLGQPQQAIKVLKETFTQHPVSILMPFVSVWPSLHPLCGNAAFLSLTTQLGQQGCVPNQ